MNYLTFIERCSRNEPSLIPIQFLVSGSDPIIRNFVLSDVARKCRAGGRPLVIISDNGATESTDLGIIQAAGYRLRNAMSGDCRLYDPFQKISTMDGLSRLRQLFTVLGYDERQKGKLIAYLNFIRHLECMKTGSSPAALTLEQLGAYCTSMSVELQLQELVDAGKLTPQQQLVYLAKYAECSGAGADLEDTLALMLPFIREQGKTPGGDPGEALVFSTGALGTDESLRSLILKLLQFSLEDRQDPNVTVLVFDRGYGSRTGMAAFLTTLPPRISLHIFSEDICTLCDSATLTMILNRFPAKVYSRHRTISSAETIEHSCGEIEVVKRTYNVAYDRRWRSNSPWDILWGNNKTETYGKTAPTREPRYRKEMIVQLPTGTGIIEYMGSTTVFSI